MARVSLMGAFAFVWSLVNQNSKLTESFRSFVKWTPNFFGRSQYLFLFFGRQFLGGVWMSEITRDHDFNKPDN